MWKNATLANIKSLHFGLTWLVCHSFLHQTTFVNQLEIRAKIYQSPRYKIFIFSYTHLLTLRSADESGSSSLQQSHSNTSDTVQEAGLCIAVFYCSVHPSSQFRLLIRGVVAEAEGQGMETCLISILTNDLSFFLSLHLIYLFSYLFVNVPSYNLFYVLTGYTHLVFKSGRH